MGIKVDIQPKIIGQANDISDERVLKWIPAPKSDGGEAQLSNT
ncbi:hypothetical protein [Pseudomonas sp. WS 5059]|nr:hypothetical protein [Pseudomonas sp. WS 5059]